MKFLVLANNSGGLANFRGKLLEKLIQKGEVVAVTPIDIRVDELISMGVKVINISLDRRGTNPISDFELLRRYNDIIRNEKPDFVITYTIKPNIYGGLACIHNRVDYVANITGLGTAFDGTRLIKKLVTFLYKRGLRRATKVFFENSENRNFFVNNRIIPKSKSHVLNGAGVDLKKFEYQQYPSNDIFIFLFIGRVMKEKGLDELIEAQTRLVAEGEKTVLHIVGRYEENYKSVLSRYENDGIIKYFGIQEDVRPFIKECDCFVLPSYHEGMANTNLECAASGRPVITSNIPGCKEAVVEGQSGLLCEPRNVEGLYQCMKKMIHIEKAEREKMGKEGRTHMEHVFDKQIVVQETIKQMGF